MKSIVKIEIDMPKQIVVIVCAIVGMLLPLIVQAQSLIQESSWVQGKEYRLKIEAFQSDTTNKHPVLVVALHGDSPFQNPDYQNIFAAKVAAKTQNVIAIGLLRPGYTDPEGNTSEGRRGKMNGDNWNTENTDAIADAIRSLKKRYESQKVVVVGHSGGAAITANILGRQPELIDAALLVSCPCEVKKWRANMRKLTGDEVFKGEIKTLSPIELVANISDQAKIMMIVGSEDKVAPPSLSESYCKKAAEWGKNIRLVQLEDKGHEIFLDTKVFDNLAEVIDKLLILNNNTMSHTNEIVFHKPQVNFYVKDLQAVSDFYLSLGFTEIFRTPEKGTPIHIELSLDSFILGIASIQAAREMHNIPAGNGGASAEIAIWTDDIDKAFNLLVQNEAQVISKPHNFLTDLRAAWVYDPEDNPVQIVAKR